jgi:hypothetical protein
MPLDGKGNGKFLASFRQMDYDNPSAAGSNVIARALFLVLFFFEKLIGVVCPCKTAIRAPSSRSRDVEPERKQ